jgi:hypothetical protein
VHAADKAVGWDQRAEVCNPNTTETAIVDKPAEEEDDHGQRRPSSFGRPHLSGPDKNHAAALFARRIE